MARGLALLTGLWTIILPPLAASSQLSVTYRPVGDLIPDPRNARTHPKRQIDQLKASIEAFGFTNPILADPEGRIIAGHGRLQAARAMGIAEVPTITLSGLSETQKRALRIADNKIALNAGWDLEILQQELGELASIDVDIDPTLTGFSTGEIDVILSSAGDPDDEVIPPAPATPRTRPGDIWILGEHRVGCGDGRDVEFLQRVIGDGARVDAAFLDPPYNVRIGGHAVSAGSHREFAMASGEMSEAEFRSFLADTLGAAARLLARWRGPLRLHGLATHGQRLGCRIHHLRRTPKPLHLEQVQCGHGIALPVQA